MLQRGRPRTVIHSVCKGQLTNRFFLKDRRSFSDQISFILASNRRGFILAMRDRDRAYKRAYKNEIEIFVFSVTSNDFPHDMLTLATARHHIFEPIVEHNSLVARSTNLRAEDSASLVASRRLLLGRAFARQTGQRQIGHDARARPPADIDNRLVGATEHALHGFEVNALA